MLKVGRDVNIWITRTDRAVIVEFSRAEDARLLPRQRSERFLAVLRPGRQARRPDEWLYIDSRSYLIVCSKHFVSESTRRVVLID